MEREADVVFTVEYCNRGAQMAVFDLMGVDEKPKEICKVEQSVETLAKA